jgi:HK97 family phage prohead protease
MENMELRFVDASFESTDDGLRVSGYVNKTNQWSQTLGQRKKFVERILPGTFNKALNNGNEIHFLAEHDNAKILSSTRNGSLVLREDEEGLYMEATIAPTSWGKDYHTLIKEGIIQNMSFGMAVLKDSWKKMSDGLYERSISDLALFEVSAVRNPAYVQSTIAARSIEVIEDVEIPEEVESENQNQRNEDNQMEMNIETRDKLVEVLDKILAKLDQTPEVTKAKEEVKEVIDKVVEAGKDIAEDVKESVEEVAETVKENVEEVVEKVEEEAKEVVEDVKEKVAEVVEEGKDVVEAVEKVVEVVVEEGKEAAKEAVDNIKVADNSEFLKKLLDF